MKQGRMFIKRAVAFIAAVFVVVSGISLSASAQEILFTQKEQDYINSRKIIKAASIDGGAPLQYKNSKGEAKGISINILEEIEALSGLDFEYALYGSIEDVLKSDADIYFCVSKEYKLPGTMPSKPYLYTEAILFYNSSLNPKELSGKRFAMIAGGTIPQGIKEEDVIYYNDRDDTFKAVNRGEADYGYSNSYSLLFCLLQNGYENITTIPRKQEGREYYISVREDDTILLGIINKTVGAISESRIQSLILSALADIEKKITPQMIVDSYKNEIIGFSLLIIVVLFYIIHLKIRANKRLDVELEKAKEQEAKIAHISFHDSLTGLYNRAYLANELERIDTPRQLPISVIVADVNGLKVVNDSFGHIEGDKIIQRAASVLKDSCRAEDVIARTGGDEFIIILPQMSLDTTMQIVERINAHCDNGCRHPIPVSISIGCATKNKPEEDLESVIKEAEAMMYRHKLLESQNVRRSIISFLQTSLHKKNIETTEHTLRLIEVTAKVGERLGLSPLEMDNLNLLSKLHDIGKITVDERLLKKKEQLTEEEMEEVRRHPEAGYRIAESTQIMANIAKYILYHHERWDGKGYPHGLKGEEIPLLSRVLAIADAYDAMTNDTPYRKAMDRKAAIDELKRHSGKQFDPGLVPIFISAIEEI